MSLRKRLRRARRLPLPYEHGPRLVTDWEAVDCPGCGLPVLFQPLQRLGACGWCARSVRRAVG